MSKKTCFMIFVVSVIVIMAAYILRIGAVTAQVEQVFSAMRSPYIAGAAVVLALLLNKQKYYWFIMLGCAVLTAVLVQLFVVGGSLAALALVYKTVAFLVYAYLVALIRFMI